MIVFYNDVQRYYKNSADLIALTPNYVTKHNKLK